MRPGWDEYFLGIADAVAKRSDCTRRQVGAVVVGSDRRIVGTGYNGAPAGQPGCDTCPRAASGVPPGGENYETGKYACVALHAEANALLYTDRTDLVGSAIYITCPPCLQCTKLIQGAGIATVYYREMSWGDRA